MSVSHLTQLDEKWDVTLQHALTINVAISLPPICPNSPPHPAFPLIIFPHELTLLSKFMTENSQSRADEMLTTRNEHISFSKAFRFRDGALYCRLVPDLR